MESVLLSIVAYMYSDCCFVVIPNYCCHSCHYCYFVVVSVGGSDIDVGTTNTCLSHTSKSGLPVLGSFIC